jgi:putative hemolysin
MSLVPALVLLAATAAAAVSAVADGALLSADTDDDADPRVRAAVADRETLHRSLSFARVAGQLVAGTAAALLVGVGRGPGGAGPVALLAVAGLALAVVLLAEGAARTVGDALGPRALRPLLPLARTIAAALQPAGALAARLDRLLQRVLPTTPLDDEEREAAEEQFREVIAAEAEVGREEEALMQRVFALSDTQVREVMVPRVDMVAIERDAPWNEVVDRVRSSEHARLPVFEDTIDDICGVLYAKDLLPTLVAEGEEPPGGWETLVRPALFIPGTKTIRDQLREFKATGNHLAIVADEYGGTAGLVTIEDILEEIVGDIHDEHDVEEPELEREGDRCFWVAGRVSLDALSDAVGHRFEADEVATVGGLVYTQLGRVPRPGEQFVLDGFRVVVERVKRRRIERVYFERVAPESDMEAEE